MVNMSLYTIYPYTYIVWWCPIVMNIIQHFLTIQVICDYVYFDLSELH